MESNFGKDKGSMGVMRSLATLIYAGGKTIRPRTAHRRLQDFEKWHALAQ